MRRPPPADNPAADLDRFDRAVARLREAARDLETVALPDEVAGQRGRVLQAFDLAVGLLYREGRLPPEALVRRLLDAVERGQARDTPLLWAREHFVHQFWTQEFVAGLADFSAGRRGLAPVLEVGAGRGDLARWLRERGVPTVATDDGSLLDGRLRWPRGVPAGVEPLSYADALARHRPAFVLCSWMPHGQDWTLAFRACPTVRHYLLIGEGPGGCTGAPASFDAPPGWRRERLADLSRRGFTRNADRAYSTSVYHFTRDA